MNVQVYIAHPDDVLLCVEAGVDLIGIVADPEMRTPSSMDFDRAKQTLARIPPSVKSVALTMDSSPDRILAVGSELQPDIIHIACPIVAVTADLLLVVKQALPEVSLMLAVPMNLQGAIEKALQFDSIVDYFISDTSNPDRADVGATGETHDWQLSKDFVEQASSPVVLAGGLSEDNVTGAIDIVSPWAVDSFSHTNRANSVRKDPVRVGEFVRRAKEAGTLLASCVL